MATYSTEIQWGGPDAAWRPDKDLTITLKNRDVVIGGGAPPAGTTLTWESPTGGKGNITFFENDFFQGSAQFPTEGPVGYRGTLKS